MKTILHKAETRGHFNYGWLDTRHTFSFSQYHNPERINFGALRVLNDDIVKEGEGFGKHPHNNMEIISIPLHGKILHRDSMGNEQFLTVNEIQVMSAGSGIFHEEYNGSNTESVNFIQIWIIPNKNNITPGYSQKKFKPIDAHNKWQTLVSPQQNETLTIQQDASISRVFLSKGNTIEYKLSDRSNGCYLFLIDGKIELNNIEINKRDGIGLSDLNHFHIKSLTDSYVLNIEIPMEINNNK